jgi:hypothetical protein
MWERCARVVLLASIAVGMLLGTARPDNADPIDAELGGAATVQGNETRHAIVLTVDLNRDPVAASETIGVFEHYNLPAAVFLSVTRLSARPDRPLLDLIQRLRSDDFVVGLLLDRSFTKVEASGVDDAIKQLAKVGLRVGVFRRSSTVSVQAAELVRKRYSLTEVRWSLLLDNEASAAAMLKVLVADGGVVRILESHPSAVVLSQLADMIDNEHCRALRTGTETSHPRALHYLIRNADGRARTVPEHAKLQTDTYLQRVANVCAGQVTNSQPGDFPVKSKY